MRYQIDAHYLRHPVPAQGQLRMTPAGPRAAPFCGGKTAILLPLGSSPTLNTFSSLMREAMGRNGWLIVFLVPIPAWCRPLPAPGHGLADAPVIRILGLALILVFTCVLFALLRLRDVATERREALRLQRLAEACAELVRLRDHASVLEALINHAMAFCTGRVTYQSAAQGPKLSRSRYQQVLSMIKQDGGSLGSLIVESTRKTSFGELAALMQLSECATAAIETISLLKSNAVALSEATRSRLEAEATGRELEAILSSMSDAMLALDHEWRLTYLNPNAAQLLGQEATRLLGHKLRDLLPAEVTEDFEALLLEAASSGIDAVFHSGWSQGGCPGDEGKRVWVMVRAFPHANGMTLYMQDITQQIETEDQLRQTAKMDALGQLTGGIAHDFNNLLTVIGGNLELLAALMPADRQEREVVELAQQAATSAASLTQKLLAFARRQPLSPSVVDVGRLIDDFSDLLRRTLGPNIQIRLLSAGSTWHARVDPTQLESAILNLAINARDAMPGGGALTIAISDHREMGEDAGFSLPMGDYVRIDVQDTGGGIAPDVLAHVFEPFFTTKPIGAGTGLGLSMVYGFAKQSGGLASISSEKGVGSCVRLLLPRGNGEELRSISRFMSDRRILGAGEQILLVEDAAIVRRYVETVLTKLGYNVLAVADGPACLRALDLGAQPDLLLTDVVLPGGMSGHVVAAEVLRRMPGLPVVLMSGYFTDGDDASAAFAHAIDLLRKPFTSQQLAERVGAALSSQRDIKISLPPLRG